MKHRLPLAWAGIGLAFVWLASAGCTGRTERVERREESHPLMRRAQARKAASDFDRAIELFEEALVRRPSLVRAHLDLGLLYEAREDYVRAVYHYERYLAMRPETGKREMVEGLVRQARLSYAASLPEQPSGAVQMIAELQRENARLREDLARQRESDREAARAAAASQSATAVATAPAASSAPAPRAAGALRAPAPEPADPAHERYTVQTGDTLTRIAARVYGDAGEWPRIFEANRDVLRDPGSVRPGQQLTIPPAEERSRR